MSLADSPFAESLADPSPAEPSGNAGSRRVDPVRSIGELQVTLVPTAVGSKVRLAGELDLTNADEVWSELEGVMAARPGDVVLDLAQLTFVDSRGLSVLIRAAQRLRPGGSITLVDMSPRVAETIRVAGVGGLFSVP
jgi:anti-anti-sigma factor